MLKSYRLILLCVLLGASAACTDTGAKPGSDQARMEAGVNDSYITSVIKARLIGMSDIKAFDIHVSTTDGVVTLTGTSPTAELRDRAIAAAQAVKGVHSVKSSIEIKP